MSAADIHDAVPAELPGPREVVEVITHYLEMHAAPPAPVAPRPEVQVVRAARPSVRFYRYLYDGVGGPWHWYDRRRMPAAALAELLADPAVEVHVLWKDGEPIGYAELDRRIAGEVELAYFGLMPEAIGQRLGPWLLGWALDAAWAAPGVTRVWVHTCSLDHARALPAYLNAGFRKYGEARHRQTIIATAARAATAPRSAG